MLNGSNSLILLLPLTFVTTLSVPRERVILISCREINSTYVWTNGEYNLKLVSADGHFEAVYDINRDLVTNPINMGTYNYPTPSVKVDHGILDVAPYLLWGNVPGSSVPKEKTEAKYNGSPDAQKHRQDIINRIGVWGTNYIKNYFTKF